MPDNSITVLRMESGPSRAKVYMNHIMRDIAIKEILDPLKVVYTEMGAPQSFIDTIDIQPRQGLRVDLVIRHPIAQWLEYGVEPHIIEAINAEYLHFEYRKTSKWIYSHARDDRVWAKALEVAHPGFPGFHILEMMLPTLVKDYERTVIEQTNEWLERTKMK